MTGGISAVDTSRQEEAHGARNGRVFPADQNSAVVWILPFAENCTKCSTAQSAERAEYESPESSENSGAGERLYLLRFPTTLI
jgi:hypothetical protein